MAILKIALMGNPVLQQICEPVEDPTASHIAALADHMRDTLTEIGGTGLAAPQVYESLRMIMVRMPAERIPPGSNLKPWPWTVMINPVLTPLVNEKTTAWERCLSIPGLHGQVPRYPRVRAEYTTLEGEKAALEAEDVQAFLLQHECDHLDGVIYPMRMTDLSYLAFNTDPGRLAAEMAAGRELDPVFVKLVEAWPARGRWNG